jgi:hypothetical protein
LLAAGHHVQVGQDGAVVDDHHAGAQAAFHGALLGVVVAARRFSSIRPTTRTTDGAMAS